MSIFTADQLQEFERDGCLLVRDLYTADEMAAMLDVARTDKAQQGAMNTGDAEGNTTRLKLTLDPEPRDDVFSALSCGQRMVERIEALMGARPMHFHHKMMLKDPEVGGAWEWHQDYGYWYLHEKFPTPELISCFVAADRATRENGCLQIIRGSHRPGRIEHGTTGKQTGADLRFVEALRERDDMQHEYVEMEPGDGVFFHSNLLHRSDKNTSDHPRWTLVCCYNHPDNLPLDPEQRHKVCPIDDIVEDDQLLPIAKEQLEDYTTPA